MPVERELLPRRIAARAVITGHRVPRQAEQIIKAPGVMGTYIPAGPMRIANDRGPPR